MRSQALVAVLLPAVLACENAKTHSCGAAFVASSAEAASFYHTYTASVVTATTDVPAAFNSACSGMAKSLSKACTCYVAASASVVEATSSAAPYPVAVSVGSFVIIDALFAGQLSLSTRIPLKCFAVSNKLCPARL